MVGGKHNLLVHYVDACAPIHLVLSPVNASIEIYLLFIFLFLIKNHVVCVPAIAWWILFHNYKEIKVIGGKQNILVHCVDVSAPDPSGIVVCNPFKWDILYFVFIFSDQKSCCFLCAYHTSKTNFIPQPQEQKSCRRQT